MTNAQIKALTPVTARQLVRRRVDWHARPRLDDVIAERDLCRQGYAGGLKRAAWIDRQIARLTG